MSRWVEVPAHRVLEVELSDFQRDFEELDIEGNVIHVGSVYRVIRKSDRKVFCVPRYHEWHKDMGRLVYLEEI